MDWARIQSRLKQLRYYTGKADGVAGDATRTAIRVLQSSNGLFATGRIDRETMVALFGADDPQADQVETGAGGASAVQSAPSAVDRAAG